MKNIQTILEEAGISIPEDKKATFDAAFAENYSGIDEVTRLRTSHDNLKGQLDDAKKTLKSFEGVDVADLKGQIAKLTGDLAAKETDYKNKLADMEFSTALDSALSASGAKNTKAVKALLDIDKLKASSNRDSDIKSALEAVKSENDYLFVSNEPVKNPVAPTSTSSIADPLAAIRSAMGIANKPLHSEKSN